MNRNREPKIDRETISSVLFLSALSLFVGSEYPLVRIIFLPIVVICIVLLLISLFRKDSSKADTDKAQQPEASVKNQQPEAPAPKTYTKDRKNLQGSWAGISYKEIYKAFLKRVKLSEEDYTIHALMTSGAVDTYTLINSGGPYKEYLEKEIGKKEAKSNGKKGGPVVIKLHKFSDDEQERWCREEKKADRIIWVTDKYRDTYTLRLRRLERNEITRRNIDSYTLSAMEEYGFSKVILVDIYRHDLKHDPWNPEYPDLTGLTLQDLQVGSVEPEHESKLFDEEELRELAARFFGGDKDAEQEKAFIRMLGFGRNWVDERRTRVWERAPIECRAGYFQRIFEWETPCYDGGNCGTDTEYDGVTFELYEEDPNEWEALVKSVENNYWYRNKDRDDLLEQWKEAWGFAGCPEELTTPICVENSKLLLLNPFGMKGIYKFSRR